MIVLSDTFTGSAGTSITAARTGQVGAGWTAAPWSSASTMAVDGSGYVINTSAGECAFVATGAGATGNQTITAYLQVNATSMSGGDAAIFFRVQSGSAINCYMLQVTTSIAILFQKWVNTGSSSLGGGSASLPIGLYRITITINSSGAMFAYVQRATDGFYLSYTTTWQAGVVSCISANDTTYGDGKTAIEYYTSSGTQVVRWGSVVVTDQVTVPTATGAFTYTAAPANITISPNDANILYSAFNWYLNGSTYSQTNYRGASMRTAFTGTSCAINVDVSPLTGAATPATSAQFPWVRYSVDDGPTTDVQLTSATTSIAALGGGTSGTHTLDLIVCSTDSSFDRWATPANVVRITGLSVDAGAATAARTDVRPNTALFMGDSITEGDGVNGAGSGNTGTPPNNDAGAVWCHAVGAALNAEVSISGMGGQGWNNAAAGGAPAFPSAWQYLSNGRARSWTTPPTYAFVNMGTNGGYTAGQLQSFITAFRAAVGATTKLSILIPFGAYNATAMASDYAAYQSATPDANLFLFNGGTIASRGLTNYGATAATAESFDGVHPNRSKHGRLAAQVAGSLLSQVASAGGGSSAAAVVTAMLDGANGLESGWTVREGLRVMLAILAGQSANGGKTFYAADASKVRVAATVDANNNRTALVVTKD